MATRTYYLDRSGTTPAKKPADSHQKMKIFPTIEEAERSIDDIAEGEIVATDGDTDDSSTIPLNILNYVRDQNELGSWHTITIGTSAEPTVMEYDGFVNIQLTTSTSSQTYYLYCSGVPFTIVGGSSSAGNTIAVKKGDSLYGAPSQYVEFAKARFYEKRDYSGR